VLVFVVGCGVGGGRPPIHSLTHELLNFFCVLSGYLIIL
jgi:hypothetical protein